MTYRRFWQLSVWNFLLATTVAVVPAFAFYSLAFNHTSRQLGILLRLTVPGIAILLAVDPAVLRWVHRAPTQWPQQIEGSRGMLRGILFPV